MRCLPALHVGEEAYRALMRPHEIRRRPEDASELMAAKARGEGQL